MKVILKQDVKGSGLKGDIIEVSVGYARNFLLKKNLAEEATSVNVNSVKIKKEAEAFHIEETKKEAKQLAENLKNVTITVKVKCGENGKIFGSVTSKEISQQLISMGYDIDKKKIVLKEPIKVAGNYQLEVKLLPQISSKISVIVENE
jgi:large subunit ribosomal protein L9